MLLNQFHLAIFIVGGVILFGVDGCADEEIVFEDIFKRGAIGRIRGERGAGCCKNGQHRGEVSFHDVAGSGFCEPDFFRRSASSSEI